MDEKKEYVEGNVKIIVERKYNEEGNIIVTEQKEFIDIPNLKSGGKKEIFIKEVFK